ncbi:ubiquinone biosynthesis protein UbiA [Nonomuraea terrae]|uniref:Ubiquinone biosynthesis protein UbiA n=1 Tax=Nonomuraea terrae TaxID=2530383 RepID=A0A4R4Z7E1_9ACTN|nr:ubiquinone biosynthesis protein UbiA [Nonomuraea terrae]
MSGSFGIRVRFFAHLEACRPDTVFYVGLVGMSGAILTDPGAGPGSLLLAWLVPTLAWIASLYGGDYFDRELDAKVKPHRPVPSGRIPAATAKYLMMALIGTGAVLAALANPFTFLLVIPATVFGIAYAKVLKGRGLWGNVSRGLPTALTLLFGSMMVQPLPEPVLLPLALMFWVHDSGSNLLGALCDRDGDRAGGYFSYPVKRGDDATVRALTMFYLGWVSIGLGWPLISPATSGVDLPVYYLALLPAVILGGISLKRILEAPRPFPRQVGLRAHEIVVLDRIFLGSFLMAAAGQVAFAVAVAAPSLLATVVARRLMRSRYEPTPQVS